jgi:flavin prenyltransferase
VRRLIIGISGASGAIYGIRALEALRDVADMETHLIVSPSGERTIREETDYSVGQVRALATRHYDFKDIGAAVSSGSFRTEGMLVAPCSVKTLSGVANCDDAELIVRAADVCLKERRRVVLLFRETPLHAGHLALMEQATRNGAIVMPNAPAFYNRPKTIDDIVCHTVGRALDLFNIETGLVKRWKDEPARAAEAYPKQRARQRARKRALAR